MADFQYSLHALKDEAIDLYAASVDPLDKAVETVKKLNLRFPVAYGLAAGQQNPEGDLQHRLHRAVHGAGRDQYRKVFEKRSEKVVPFEGWKTRGALKPRMCSRSGVEGEGAMQDKGRNRR
ncbi:MAG: hypothetical protein ACOC3A_10465 [Thermodesulfobacteriota bacterium]